MNNRIYHDDTRSQTMKSIDSWLNFLVEYGGDETGLNYLRHIKDEVQARIENIEDDKVKVAEEDD